MFIIQYEHVPGERVLLLRSPLYICMYVCVDVEKIAYIYEREYRTLYKIGSWRSEFGIGIPLYMCTYVYVYVEIMRTEQRGSVDYSLCVPSGDIDNNCSSVTSQNALRNTKFSLSKTIFSKNHVVLKESCCFELWIYINIKVCMHICIKEVLVCMYVCT